MTEHPALVAASAFGLPGRRDVVVIDPAEADTVLAVARHDRLGGFLGRALEAGLVECDSATAESITTLWHEDLVGSVAVEAMVVRMAAVLDGAGVQWRLTKGAAVAHLDYRDPSIRSFGDADVLVHPDSWTSAINALAGHGFLRGVPELRSGFDLRFGKGATLTNAEGFEIDLHLRLAIGRFGITSHPADLFDPAERLELGGRAVPALARDGRLLHACFHACLGGFRHLRAHRDIAQLVLVSGASWEQVVERARRWRAEVVVATAVLDTWRMFGLDPDHAAYTWASGYVPTRREAEAVEIFRRERPFSEQALTALAVLPWRDRPRYLLALAEGSSVPEERHRSLGRRLVRAATSRFRSPSS